MLPKEYRLSVVHNFGANATVTVKGTRYKINAADGVLTYNDETWINAATVPDATPENSADQDNDTNKDYGLHGLLIVSGTTLSGIVDLYLGTKDGTDYSDITRGRLLVSIDFDGVNGPLKAAFDTDQ